MTAIGSVAAINAPKASAGAERPAEPPDQAGGDDASAEQHADGRQRQHRREIALELAPRNAERGLEQQWRQDDLEQDVVGQRQVDLEARQRQRQPGCDEADGVGQAQAAGDDRHRHGDPEQLDPRGDDTVHHATVTGAHAKRNSPPTRRAARFLPATMEVDGLLAGLRPPM